MKVFNVNKLATAMLVVAMVGCNSESPEYANDETLPPVVTPPPPVVEPDVDEYYKIFAEDLGYSDALALQSFCKSDESIKCEYIVGNPVINFGELRFSPNTKEVTNTPENLFPLFIGILVDGREFVKSADLRHPVTGVYPSHDLHYANVDSNLELDATFYYDESFVDHMDGTFIHVDYEVHGNSWNTGEFTTNHHTYNYNNGYTLDVENLETLKEILKVSFQ